MTSHSTRWNTFRSPGFNTKPMPPTNLHLWTSVSFKPDVQPDRTWGFSQGMPVPRSREFPHRRFNGPDQGSDRGASIWPRRQAPE